MKGLVLHQMSNMCNPRDISPNALTLMCMNRPVRFEYHRYKIWEENVRRYKDDIRKSIAKRKTVEHNKNKNLLKWMRRFMLSQNASWVSPIKLMINSLVVNKKTKLFLVLWTVFVLTTPELIVNYTLVHTITSTKVPFICLPLQSEFVLRKICTYVEL